MSDILLCGTNVWYMFDCFVLDFGRILSNVSILRSRTRQSICSFAENALAVCYRNVLFVFRFIGYDLRDDFSKYMILYKFKPHTYYL